ncbi:hypothetical protein EG329_003725 [Mollisiaceae sp. DMI_Dod_QoI]|nr:hypothetical protein EG329_003725 [Helotiales sp. DMI_Dod_QoI]
MLTNPFSRPTRTIILLVIFLLVGMYFYRPVHQVPRAFPHLDTHTLHHYLNRSEHVQRPLALMAKLQKHLQHTDCVPETKVVSSITHHYRTETKTNTVVSTMTQTALLQPTCDANIDAPKVTKEDATPEQLTVAKLRDEGIIIIFKAGAQEVSHLAIQVGTTLRYLSSHDILFFSDQQGSIGPFLINDALRNVDQKLKNDHPDFEIYRQIKKYQSTGQDILELQEDKKKGDGRSGWKLDKYKFIHMIEETFEMRPDAKWYVFIETDSYVFWDNLAEWLKRLDSKKPWYIGSEVSSNGVSFAHGGSGYILSNAAMNKLLGPEQPQGLAASWDSRMKDVPYGDLALAMALKEKGVPLTVGHPLLNGYKPSTFTYGLNNHWCQPVVTMHHVVPHEVSSVWRYERQREQLGMANTTLFADLYSHFVEPHLVNARDNWDNLSHGPTYSQQLVDELKKQQADVEKKKEDEEKKRKEKEEKEKAKENKLKSTQVKNALEINTHGAKNEIEPTPKNVQDPKDEKPKQETMGKEDQTGKEPMKAVMDESNLEAKKADAQPDDAETEESKKLDLKDVKGIDVGEDDVEGEDEKSKDAHEKDAGKEARKEDVKREDAGNSDDNESAKTNPADDLSPASHNDLSGLSKRGDPPKPRIAQQQHAHESFEKCGEACEEEAGCFQWVYYSKTCKLGSTFRLGKYVKPSDDGKVVWKSG